MVGSPCRYISADNQTPLRMRSDSISHRLQGLAAAGRSHSRAVSDPETAMDNGIHLDEGAGFKPYIDCLQATRA